MKVCVNKDVCIGCGACTAIASGVFEIGDDGLAETIENKDSKMEISEDVKDDVLDAADGCPVGAIQTEE